MKLLSKLSPKMKVLILIVYTAVVVVLGVIVFNFVQPQNVDNFKEYQDAAFDENISFIVRVRENRTSADVSSETSKEKAYWDVMIYFTKKDSSLQIRKVHTLLSAVGEDGSLIYNERLNSVSLTSTTIPSVSITSFAKKTNEYNSTTKEYQKTNHELSRLYIKVMYEIKNSDNVFEFKTINYKIELLKEIDYKFDSFNERLTKQEAGNKKGYFESEKELFELLVEARLNTEDNPKDRFRITAIEGNEVYNQDNKIKNLKLVVFGKAENDPSDTEEYFSNYIKIEQFYGVIDSKAKVNAVVTLDYNKNYEINKLYFVGITTDSKQETTTTLFWADVCNLKTY